MNAITHDDGLKVVASDGLLSRLLRDNGIDLVDMAADNWWKEIVDDAIAYLAATGTPFTADDVRDLGIPDPHAPQAWGARFMAATRAGLIVRVGDASSRRPSVHAHRIGLYVGAEAVSLQHRQPDATTHESTCTCSCAARTSNQRITAQIDMRGDQ